MAKGSKVVPVRIPDSLLADVEDEVVRTNAKTRGEPYTLSSWIRKAIEEKIAHLKRSRKEIHEQALKLLAELDS